MKNTFLAHAGQALRSLLFPDGNSCHLCGQPMLRMDEPLLCGACGAELAEAFIPMSDQPLFIHPALPCSIAAYQYNSVAQELVQALKYRHDPWAAEPLSEGMAHAFAQIDASELHRADMLIPVPLHPKREKERGYNQAALIAERLSTHIGLPQHPHALARIRNTRPQVGTSRERRLQNMIGAFSVAELPLICQKHVLLIDDVCTTGATAIACAQALFSCGASEVTLFTACRA